MSPAFYGVRNVIDLKILIRVDASIDIGTGHVMRCVALAHALHLQGHKIIFVCRDLPGNLCVLLEQWGYQVRRLHSFDILPDHWRRDIDDTISVVAGLHFDWLIVDHYQLDARWESVARTVAQKIMVIDDLANRKHDCDVVLDQNLYGDMRTRYDGLVRSGCVQLLGPHFALLRDEFLKARQHLRLKDAQVHRILIFFGGSDPTNETSKALQAIRLVGRVDIAVDVVVGTSNPHRVDIQKLCGELPSISYHCQTQNMADLMHAADIALGAGGSASWERCCVGLPAILIAVADNQMMPAAECAKAGAAYYLGVSAEVSVEQIKHAIERFLQAPQTLRSMTTCALKLVDGLGVQRVINHLGEQSVVMALPNPSV